MGNDIVNGSSTSRKSILVVSIAKHLIGVSVNKGIEVDWAKAKAHDVAPLFENVGFDLDTQDVSKALQDLKKELEGKKWSGVLIGWCIRGHLEFTELFEDVVTTCFEVVKTAPQLKIMFSTGPNNLVETVLRNFPMKGDQ